MACLCEILEVAAPIMQAETALAFRRGHVLECHLNPHIGPVGGFEELQVLDCRGCPVISHGWTFGLYVEAAVSTRA
jgi:hypothetical protein